jgi:hypothetical protein
LAGKQLHHRRRPRSAWRQAGSLRLSDTRPAGKTYGQAQERKTSHEEV